ncbi:MAG: hypothetical protein N3B13_06845, partial [Deltaproteobacteria bacterium]|nr:hypothetical protein [Deltaproteobacteria bacterium]
MTLIFRKAVLYCIVILVICPAVLSAQTNPPQNTPQTQQTTEVKAEQADDVKASDASPQTAPKAQTGDDTNVMNEAYTIQIKNLEEKVNELKERVFRSKARLTLLQETVLMGKISGAKINVLFDNQMGSSFKIESVSFSLDGTQ